MKEAQLEHTSDPDDHLLITPRLHSHHIRRKTQVFHFILIWPVPFGSTTFCHSWCTKAGCGKTKVENHSAISCHNGTLT